MTARDVRRAALQALYQFDAAGDASPDVVRASLEESAGDEKSHEDGFRLAVAAWARHAEADSAVSERTPEWPTHRQPVVDRNILRLAYHELMDGRTPPKVVINEAVELAKEFSTEKSPLFVNGVLDKIYKAMPGVEPDADIDVDVDVDVVVEPDAGQPESEAGVMPEGPAA